MIVLIFPIKNLVWGAVSFKKSEILDFVLFPFLNWNNFTKFECIIYFFSYTIIIQNNTEDL